MSVYIHDELAPYVVHGESDPIFIHETEAPIMVDSSPEQRRNYVDVVADFGASENLSDNYSKIQAAIDTAVENKVYGVFIPPTKGMDAFYPTLEPLVIPSFLELYGTGYKSFIKNVNQTGGNKGITILCGCHFASGSVVLETDTINAIANTFQAGVYVLQLQTIGDASKFEVGQIIMLWNDKFSTVEQTRFYQQVAKIVSIDLGLGTITLDTPCYKNATGTCYIGRWKGASDPSPKIIGGLSKPVYGYYAEGVSIHDLRLESELNAFWRVGGIYKSKVYNIWADGYKALLGNAFVRSQFSNLHMKFRDGGLNFGGWFSHDLSIRNVHLEWNGGSAGVESSNPLIKVEEGTHHNSIEGVTVDLGNCPVTLPGISINSSAEFCTIRDVIIKTGQASSLANLISITANPSSPDYADVEYPNHDNVIENVLADIGPMGNINIIDVQCDINRKSNNVIRNIRLGQRLTTTAKVINIVGDGNIITDIFAEQAVHAEAAVVITGDNNKVQAHLNSLNPWNNTVTGARNDLTVTTKSGRSIKTTLPKGKYISVNSLVVDNEVLSPTFEAQRWRVGDVIKIKAKGNYAAYNSSKACEDSLG